MKFKFICQPLNAEGGSLAGGSVSKETFEDAQKWAQNHINVTPSCHGVGIYEAKSILVRKDSPTELKAVS